MSLTIIAITFDRHFFDLEFALKIFNFEGSLKLEHIYQTATEYIFSSLKTFDLHKKHCQFKELEDYLKFRGVEKFEDLDHRSVLRNEAADLNIDIAKGITLHVKSRMITPHFWEKQSMYFDH